MGGILPEARTAGGEWIADGERKAQVEQPTWLAAASARLVSTTGLVAACRLARPASGLALLRGCASNIASSCPLDSASTASVGTATLANPGAPFAAPTRRGGGRRAARRYRDSRRTRSSIDHGFAGHDHLGRRAGV